MKKLIRFVPVDSKSLSPTPRWSYWLSTDATGSTFRLRRISSNKIQQLRTSSKLILRRLRWFHLPISYAVTLFFLGQVRRYRSKRSAARETGAQGHESSAGGDEHTNITSSERFYKPFTIEASMYRLLPLRTISRIWGWLNSLELPQAIRTPILKSYIKLFGCDLTECYCEDLQQYKNLGEFFRRELKPGLRPIAGKENDVVSPCDGTILHYGSAQNGYLEQVKGITYTLESFLGPNTWNKQVSASVTANATSSGDHPGYQQTLLHNPEKNSLYYCVIYLAPGDYHRFHSPVNWTVRFRRHFPGKLLSVRPTFASWFPNLFSINERVCYIGDWKHGFFAMVPVGATNVGSMRIYFDKKLRTNQTQIPTFNGKIDDFEDKNFDKKPVPFKKGDPFGEFNLGSTIVLIFEAPKNQTKFTIKNYMKIKYGELIGDI